MVVFMVMMTAPVFMLLDTVDKYSPLAVVDMTMGIMAAVFWRFDLVTKILRPSLDRPAPLEVRLLSLLYCTVSLIFPHRVLGGIYYLPLLQNVHNNPLCHWVRWIQLPG